MTDEELLEWYKNNSTKPENMSQKDYELNVNKAIKLQADNQLQSNLANQQAAIEKAQSNAQQSASISNEKLMKYLGQSQIANNVATGQRGSDFIAANNNYMQTRANIANNAAQQQADLLENYNIGKLENANNAYNKEVGILDKYRERDLEDESWNLTKEQYAKSERQAHDDYWLSSADERAFTLYKNFIDEDGNISDENKQKIKAALEEYKLKMFDDEYKDRIDEIYKNLMIE